MCWTNGRLLCHETSCSATRTGNSPSHQCCCVTAANTAWLMISVAHTVTVISCCDKILCKIDGLMIWNAADERNLLPSTTMRLIDGLKEAGRCASTVVQYNNQATGLFTQCVSTARNCTMTSRLLFGTFQTNSTIMSDAIKLYNTPTQRIDPFLVEVFN